MTKMTSRILSTQRQTRQQHLRTGCPWWWARAGGERVQLPWVYGTEYLDVAVVLPVGTVVQIGAGAVGSGRKGNCIRETVTTKAE